MTATAESRAKAPWSIRDVDGICLVCRLPIATTREARLAGAEVLLVDVGKYRFVAAIRAIAETQDD